ncbi:unnamed protein product [Phytophthora fragariaefolia]|uniref:Unnamed protein product n=1 Tax=Phytophthora fragariaefolia TaxID=1490495 RepID=A0A9W6UBI7_9STRA|nr:unnamed protein product [Phytophthora fragariaefolia]
MSAEPDASAPAIWMWLAGEVCRGSDISFPLSTGKTSAATKHLKKAHDVTSEKTETAIERRRSREDELDRVRSSPMFHDDPGRVYVLMETLRIVNNNLPYRLGEYEESVSIRELVFKDAMQATINAKVVCHTIIELYTSTKRALEEVLQLNRIGSAPTFTAVADIWTSKVQGVKYLGIRLYMVTEKFEFKSILLGTRHFVPEYGEREGGIRLPFRRWIIDILADFGLTLRDLFGATSDAGPDVKWMMTEGLKLNLQWCIPHMTNAATKVACGMVADATKSKNPATTNLIRRIVKTVYTVKHVEVMGSLFEELCLYGKSGKSPHQLLEYRAHRFLGLTRVVKRILDLWGPLVSWYAERLDKARRDNANLPAGFPLERDYQHLTQILSLLQPITLVNIKSQGESANQVDVLLTLYKLRPSVLDCSKELRDYRSSKERRMAFRPEELTPLASDTRRLLHNAFHKRFFSRYTDRTKINTCSFVLEMQLFLHPNFKSFDGFLKRIVMLCNADQNGTITANGERIFARIKKIIYDKVRSLMLSVAQTQESRAPVVVEELPPAPPTLFSEDLMELFGDIIDEHHVGPEEVRDMNAARVDEELERWEGTQTSIQINGKRPETVLEFWKRQVESGAYKFLPLVARILYAIPSSSAQIERDFGTAGQLVTPQRGSIAPHNVDMSAFLNCNRQFVDVTQCPKIRERAITKFIPSNVKVGLEDDSTEGCELLGEFFSADSDAECDEDEI